MALLRASMRDSQKRTLPESMSAQYRMTAHKRDFLDSRVHTRACAIASHAQRCQLQLSRIPCQPSHWPAGWLADGCPRRGLWRPAPAARAARPNAAALIRSSLSVGCGAGPFARFAGRLTWLRGLAARSFETLPPPALALGRSTKLDRLNNGRKALETSGTRLMHLCCFSSARARRAG